MEGNPVDAPSTINLAALMMHNVEESIAAGQRDRRLQENRYLLDPVPAAEIGSRAGPVHAASLKVWSAIAARSRVPYLAATILSSIQSDLINHELLCWDEVKHPDPDRHASIIAPTEAPNS